MKTFFITIYKTNMSFAVICHKVMRSATWKALFLDLKCRAKLWNLIHRSHNVHTMCTKIWKPHRPSAQACYEHVRNSKSIINFNPKTFNPLHHHHQPARPAAPSHQATSPSSRISSIRPTHREETTIHLSTQMFGILYKGRSSVGLDRIALLYFLTTL